MLQRQTARLKDLLKSQNRDFDKEMDDRKKLKEAYKNEAKLAKYKYSL